MGGLLRLWIFAVLACFCVLTLPVLGQVELNFVDSVHRSGLGQMRIENSTTQYLPILMVAGLALFDFDNDGWTDIYLLNQNERQLDSDQSTNPAALRPLGNRLFRNLQDGTFADVTLSAGVSSGAFALGVVAADLDNDGDQDLVTSNYGLTQYYINNGDGTFVCDSVNHGIGGSHDQFGAGIACLDIDNDGCLDLYASNYVDFTLDRYKRVASRSFPYPPGPKDFPPSADRLYRNLGNGLFDDISHSSGIAATAGPSMGIVCGDFDGDHDADIFVCSDAAPNEYFVNDGTGHFTELALASGLAYDGDGKLNGSMGVDAGDYDNDGKIDLLITNYSGQTPVLYRNLGNGLFEDTSRVSQVGRSVLAHTNWGVAMVDFDNDRDLDVFFANGHFLTTIESIDDRTSFRVKNTLMINDGRGRFSDASNRSGSGLQVLESSRGAAFDDLDGDGDIDGVVFNANAVPTVLENRSQRIGSWLNIRLIGTRSNRDAVGAKVEISSDGHSQVAMVHAGRGYQSHYGTVLHFGLGESSSVAPIRVTWPGGDVEFFPCDRVRTSLVLIQGSGIPVNP
jgi:enediyne biosynthesis protein E4